MNFQFYLKNSTKVIIYVEVVQGVICYGTEYEIWADFGPVGNTEKKYWVVKYICYF